MQSVTVLLLLASVSFGQQVTRLEQLRETKDPGGHPIFSQALRAQMQFAEERLAEFVANRNRVVEDQRKNIPGYSGMVDAHRDQLTGLEMMARSAFAKAAYSATEHGLNSLRTVQQRKVFFQWEKEGYRQIRGKKPNAVRSVSRATARLPSRKYKLFCILGQGIRVSV